MTKSRAFRLIRKRNRRLALLAAGAVVGALCPHLPPAFEPVCRASVDVVRTLVALLTGVA